MNDDNKCSGFNAFFHDNFYNNNTAQGRKSLETSSKLIETWNKLTSEEKNEWKDKEQNLRE